MGLNLMERFFPEETFSACHMIGVFGPDGALYYCWSIGEGWFQKNVFRIDEMIDT